MHVGSTTGLPNTSYVPEYFGAKVFSICYLILQVFSYVNLLPTSHVGKFQLLATDSSPVPLTAAATPSRIESVNQCLSAETKEQRFLIYPPARASTSLRCLREIAGLCNALSLSRDFSLLLALWQELCPGFYLPANCCCPSYHSLASSLVGYTKGAKTMPPRFHWVYS